MDKTVTLLETKDCMMRKVSQNNLLTWVLAFAVMFAPVQIAVSAIDMLDHNETQSQHCQMEKNHQAQQDASDQADCCQNGFDCAKCFTVHAMMHEPQGMAHSPHHTFNQVYRFSDHGIAGQDQFRPPRSFS
ncbi:MAG: hypothetical protein OEY52_11665 [Gammaproteobacteria bacterium]|nr:hypothetical protein [Gammaproteobacteria bacterium]